MDVVFGVPFLVEEIKAGYTANRELRIQTLSEIEWCSHMAACSFNEKMPNFDTLGHLRRKCRFREYYWTRNKQLVRVQLFH